MNKNLSLKVLLVTLLWPLTASNALAFHIGLGNAVASQASKTISKAAKNAGYNVGPPIQFAVEAVQPVQVSSVSKLYSCQGHPYPDQGSLSSGKHYFWPALGSQDTGPTQVTGLMAPIPISTHTPIYVMAPCNGTLLLSHNDISANTNDQTGVPGFLDADGNPTGRGYAYHFACSNSQTSLRFFHLILAASVSLNQSVAAGTILGTADVRCLSYFPDECSNFDIAVSELNDENVVSYFSKLSPRMLQNDWGITNLSSVENPASTDCQHLYPTQPYNNSGDSGDIVPVR